MANKISEIELSYRPATGLKPVVTTCLSAYEILYEAFPQATIDLMENIVIMYLNRANRVIGLYQHSSGGIANAIMDIRLILAVALKCGGSGLIMAHNHPSGNLIPSNADRIMTNKLKEGASLFDLSLYDHLIVTGTRGQYYSFADNALI